MRTEQEFAKNVGKEINVLQNPYKTAETILSASSKPSGKLKSVDLYGSSVKEKNEGSLCSTFHLENESGTGNIAAYSVFPGMELVYQIRQSITSIGVTHRMGVGECLFLLLIDF